MNSIPMRAGAIIMGLQRTRVHIELDTVIRDDQTMDRIKHAFKGTLAKNERMTVITYREHLEDDQHVDTFMTITDEKINVKRTGAVSMNQAFVEQARTECVYTHPHGNMHMETFTTESSHNVTENGGKVVLIYEVKLNGQDSRQHELELTYQEEE